MLGAAGRGGLCWFKSGCGNTRRAKLSGEFGQRSAPADTVWRRMVPLDRRPRQKEAAAAPEAAPARFPQ